MPNTLLNLDFTSALTGSTVKMLPVSDIEPNPNQPRTEFDQDKIKELAASLSTGQAVAILVTPKPGVTGKYIIVDGERRWRSAKAQGKKTLCALLVNGNPDQLFLLSFVANVARVGHTPLEIARSLARVKRITSGTDEEVGRTCGQSGGWVAQHLSLLRLPIEVQRLMSAPTPVKKRISLSTGLLLVTLPETDQVRYGTMFHKRNISYSRAKSIIEMRRTDLQLSGKRKIQPKDEYRKLVRLAFNLKDSLDLHLKKTPEMFADIMRFRSPSEIETLLNTLKGSQTDLVKLTEKIQAASKAGLLKK